MRWTSGKVALACAGTGFAALYLSFLLYTPAAPGVVFTGIRIVALILVGLGAQAAYAYWSKRRK